MTSWAPIRTWSTMGDQEVRVVAACAMDFASAIEAGDMERMRMCANFLRSKLREHAERKDGSHDDR